MFGSKTATISRTCETVNHEIGHDSSLSAREDFACTHRLRIRPALHGAAGHSAEFEALNGPSD